MAEPSKDLILSYVVHTQGGHINHHEGIVEALDKGYRIVDVIQTQAAVGGSAGSYGAVVVTVVLSQPNSGMIYSGYAKK